jgi:hypothetical protein
MLSTALAVPFGAMRLARRAVTAALGALEAAPRIAVALDELAGEARRARGGSPAAVAIGDVRDMIAHIERLTSYVAEELPDVVYQLEDVRARLGALEHGLAERDGAAVTPGSPRSG